MFDSLKEPWNNKGVAKYDKLIRFGTRGLGALYRGGRTWS